MGSNMAESHPVGFHWPVLAQQRGAVLMHVDPRYTRTSAVADVFVKIRAGTDIAFLGGIVRYILEGERYFKEYVVHYTNAATLVADEYRHEEEAGLFTGFNPATGSYDLVWWIAVALGLFAAIANLPVKEAAIARAAPAAA